MEKLRFTVFDLLPLARERILDEYKEEVNLGKPIHYKELRRRFGLLYSFDTKTSNQLIKALAERYANIEKGNHGLILHKRR